jgi:hypothetical protein
MGRHVNFADEQERWLNKANKINKNIKHQNLEDRDPASLTLAEQFELAKKQRNERKRLKEIEANTPKKTNTHYSHYRPK